MSVTERAAARKSHHQRRMVEVMLFYSSTGSTFPTHRRLGPGQVVSGLLQVTEKRRQAVIGRGQGVVQRFDVPLDFPQAGGDLGEIGASSVQEIDDSHQSARQRQDQDGGIDQRDCQYHAHGALPWASLSASDAMVASMDWAVVRISRAI